MKISLVPTLPEEVPALVGLDEQLFPPDDRFSPELWYRYQSLWIFADDQVAGALAFSENAGPGINFSEDDRSSVGDIFLASIGIGDAFRGRGIATGTLQLLIELSNAKGFRRIVSNYRRSNAASAALHKKCGFEKVCEIIKFYADGEDAIVVARAL